MTFSDGGCEGTFESDSVLFDGDDRVRWNGGFAVDLGIVSICARGLRYIAGNRE